MQVIEKHCKYCDRLLPVERFTKRSASPDGLSYKCRSCASAYSKERYGSVPGAREAAKERAARWHKENADKSREIKARSAARKREVDPGYSARRARELRLKTLEHSRAIGVVAAHRRRMRVLDVGATHPGVYKRLMKRANGKCTYCGQQFEKLTLDHFNPITRGGDGLVDNLIPCCKSCNSSKHNRVPEDWIFDKFGIDGIARVLREGVRLYAARFP